MLVSLFLVLFGSKKKEATKVSPGQRFQTLPNILDAALLVVLVAFSAFLSSPGSGQYGDDEDWYSHKGEHTRGIDTDNTCRSRVRKSDPVSRWGSE